MIKLSTFFVMVWAILGSYAAAHADAISPTQASDAGIIPVVSSAAEGSHVLCPSACNFYSLYVTTGATPGFVLLFNQVTVPADGAVTPIDCVVVGANSTSAIANSGEPPTRFSSGGLVAVFSTTGCFTKTISGTAFFKAKVF